MVRERLESLQTMTATEQQGWSAVRRVLMAYAPGSRANILNHLEGKDMGIEVKAKALTDETLRIARKVGTQ